MKQNIMRYYSKLIYCTRYVHICKSLMQANVSIQLMSRNKSCPCYVKFLNLFDNFNVEIQLQILFISSGRLPQLKHYCRCETSLMQILRVMKRCNTANGFLIKLHRSPNLHQLRPKL